MGHTLQVVGQSGGRPPACHCCSTPCCSSSSAPPPQQQQLPALPAAWHALDLGCGSSQLAFELARAGYDHVLAVDYSQVGLRTGLGA